MLALTLTLAALIIHGSSAAAASGCDLIASPGGSDSAPGTEAEPLETATALISSLESGETGCLRAGTYVGRQFEIRTPGVTLTSFPGERATLHGQLRFGYKADGSVAENMNLDGRNDDELLGPLIYADDAILRGNVITNHHQGICVAVSNYQDLPPTRGVLIENNVIHDCGELPATNHHHGIYVSHARDTVIRNNVIYGNADRGVQLYPDADDSIVTGNVIDGNGQGVIFGGGPDSSSDDNLVAGNVITGSNIRWNIQSHWQGPVGSGNVARDNCVWTTRDDYEGTPPGSGIEEMNGARAFDNVVADPGYADPASGDYRLDGDSRCAAVLDGELPPPPVEEPTEPPTTPPGPGGGSSCQSGGGSSLGRQIVGTQGRDRLVGGRGSDRLAGKRGHDLIVGGDGGPDCLLGGRSSDRIRAVNGGRDIVKCGGGRDRATVDRKDRARGCERVIVRGRA